MIVWCIHQTSYYPQGANAISVLAPVTIQPFIHSSHGIFGVVNVGKEY